MSAETPIATNARAISQKMKKNMSNFRKIEKMKKWKIDFLEICNFSKKMKKGNERKITKNEKMGGARFARAPHLEVLRSFSIHFGIVLVYF